MTVDDKRHGARIAVDLPARYRSSTMCLDGRAGNLSPNGMLFLTGALDPNASDVHIELDLPDAGAPLRIDGEVRWLEAQGMGIRFTRITLSERRRLANFVLRRTSNR